MFIDRGSRFMAILHRREAPFSQLLISLSVSRLMDHDRGSRTNVLFLYWELLHTMFATLHLRDWRFGHETGWCQKKFQMASLCCPIFSWRPLWTSGSMCWDLDSAFARLWGPGRLAKVLLDSVQVLEGLSYSLFVACHLFQYNPIDVVPRLSGSSPGHAGLCAFPLPSWFVNQNIWRNCNFVSIETQRVRTNVILAVRTSVTGRAASPSFPICVSRTSC